MQRTTTVRVPALYSAWHRTINVILLTGLICIDAAYAPIANETQMKRKWSITIKGLARRPALLGAPRILVGDRMLLDGTTTKSQSQLVYLASRYMVSPMGRCALLICCFTGGLTYAIVCTE